MDEQLVHDLAIATRDRVRKAVDLTVQLLDDDDAAIAAVLMIVASDLVRGADAHIYRSDKSLTKDDSLAIVLRALLEMLGAKKVRNAIKKDMKGSK